MPYFLASWLMGRVDCLISLRIAGVVLAFFGIRPAWNFVLLMTKYLAWLVLSSPARLGPLAGASQPYRRGQHGLITCDSDKGKEIPFIVTREQHPLKYVPGTE